MSKGGQTGNNNAGRGREVTRALEKALARKSSMDDTPFVARFEALVKIWTKQINKALKGDNQSATMITDRLEGKPVQAHDIEQRINASVTELTNSELEDIATGGSEGDSEEERG